MEQGQGTYMIVVGLSWGFSGVYVGEVVLFDQEDSERKEFLGGVFIR